MTDYRQTAPTPYGQSPDNDTRTYLQRTMDQIMQNLGVVIAQQQEAGAGGEGMGEGLQQLADAMQASRDADEEAHEGQLAALEAISQLLTAQIASEGEQAADLDTIAATLATQLTTLNNTKTVEDQQAATLAIVQTALAGMASTLTSQSTTLAAIRAASEGTLAQEQAQMPILADIRTSEQAQQTILGNTLQDIENQVTTQTGTQASLLTSEQAQQAILAATLQDIENQVTAHTTTLASILTSTEASRVVQQATLQDIEDKGTGQVTALANLLAAINTLNTNLVAQTAIDSETRDNTKTLKDKSIGGGGGYAPTAAQGKLKSYNVTLVALFANTILINIPSGSVGVEMNSTVSNLAYAIDETPTAPTNVAVVLGADITLNPATQMGTSNLIRGGAATPEVRQLPSTATQIRVKGLGLSATVLTVEFF